MNIAKSSACYSCRGCYDRHYDSMFKPKADINCDLYLPADVKNHFMDKIIDSLQKSTCRSRETNKA